MTVSYLIKFYCFFLYLIDLRRHPPCVALLYGHIVVYYILSFLIYLLVSEVVDFSLFLSFLAFSMLSFICFSYICSNCLCRILYIYLSLRLLTSVLSSMENFSNFSQRKTTISLSILFVYFNSTTICSSSISISGLARLFTRGVP